MANLVKFAWVKDVDRDEYVYVTPRGIPLGFVYRYDTQWVAQVFKKNIPPVATTLRAAKARVEREIVKIMGYSYPDKTNPFHPRRVSYNWVDFHAPLYDTEEKAQRVIKSYLPFAPNLEFKVRRKRNGKFQVLVRVKRT